MSINDDLVRSLEAHEQREKKKETKKYWRKPYKQRWPLRRTRWCMCNTIEGGDKDVEVTIMVATKVVVVETTMKREMN